MYPDTFDYYRPNTLEEAIETLSEQENAEILAGGYSLIPSMKTGSAPSKSTGLDPAKKTGLASPDALIDIGGIDELRGISYGGETTTIGALTKYVTLCRDAKLDQNARVIKEAAKNVGTTQIRNRGTIGGNIAYADPASDLPGAVLAADATVLLRGSDGERTVHTDNLFLGDCETDIKRDEILTEVRVPQHDGDVHSAYRRRTSPSSGYAVIGVGAVLRTENGTIRSARIAANGLTNRAIRINPSESALEGVGIDDTSEIKDAAEKATQTVESGVLSDINASSSYRQNLLRIYVEEAVTAAANRARENPSAG